MPPEGSADRSISVVHLEEGRQGQLSALKEREGGGKQSERVERQRVGTERNRAREHAGHTFHSVNYIVGNRIMQLDN